MKFNVMIKIVACFLLIHKASGVLMRKWSCPYYFVLHHYFTGSGQTVQKALDVLRTYDVPMENVILLTLFTSPDGKSLISVCEW